MFQNAIAEENQLLSGAESQQAEVRVAFGEGQQDQVVAASEDQQTAAQTNSASIDEISLDDADTSEENRNKRCVLTAVLHCHINLRVAGTIFKITSKTSKSITNIVDLECFQFDL